MFLRRPPRYLILLVIFLLGTLSGCSKEKPSTNPTKNEESSVPAPPADSTLRIVSFSPAITRSLVHLGLAPYIVGRGAFCNSVDASIPVVGDLNTVNYEQLLRVRPTHVLIQPPASGLDPELRALVDKHGWRLGRWRLNSMEDIRIFLAQLPEIIFPVDSEQQVSLRQECVIAIDSFVNARIPLAGKQLWSGRILIVNALDPVMAFGQETYLNDLISALGSRNAVFDRGWITLSLEDIVRLNPEAIIIVSPNAAVEIDPFAAVGPLAGMDIDAVHYRRIAILRHPDALLPCSTLAEVTRELRTILHDFAEPNGS